MVDRLKQDMRSKDRKTRIQAQRERSRFGDFSKKPRTTSTTSGKSKLTREQLLQQAKGKNPTGLATNPGVRRDQRKKKRFALGGEAGESVGRATVERSQRKIRRKEVDDMLDRVYRKKPTIKPKKKPKPPLKKKMKNKIVPKKKPKLKPLLKPSEMKGLPPKRG